MFSESVLISFPDTDDIKINFRSSDNQVESIPKWSKLDDFPCPGNQKCGPHIDYCRLAIDIIDLINYFSNISSITEGKIKVILRDNLELTITGDAQTLFYKILWFILLTSNCSVFKYSQWLRTNYIPSSNPKRMLYMLFSIFVTEQYSVNPDEKIDIHYFQAEMQLIKEVLNNLLERVRRGIPLSSDSIENGLNRFSSIVTLFDIELDSLMDELKEEIKNGCLLSKYKLSETTTTNQFGEETYKLDEI